MSSLNPHVTVRELIGLLAQFNGDMPVLTDGYESGLDDIKNVRLVIAGKPRFNDEWAGEFEVKQGLGKSDFQAVHIGARV
ncbi:hypothetical protein [Duganella violaceipulchra]|uniref:Uncharacterized protein n=1 Tax=Duganella violaceipulchra TaxID=2849652 RepID=A0AA41HD26_9BURK|nr:hypothetical protein [Duganella violaceicalia]MBV6324376.1 hypothetical protein [Duganella violaceicalia]MCP2007230.1 hypothetical protein [Duganella violaceicalia]